MDYLERVVTAFAQLGKWLQFAISSENISGDINTGIAGPIAALRTEIDNSVHHNGWFTKGNVCKAIEELSILLDEESLRQWISGYPGISHSKDSRWKVGVIMAGNIPLVGFLDFLCVLISGNSFRGKLSSDDSQLLPAVANLLVSIEPELKNKIEFSDGMLTSFDAVIATGSNNTARYFEYYFGKYPHIIRKNRNSVAILTGAETKEDLEGLAIDIFRYFGLGCRNVSKIFIPADFVFDPLFEAFESWRSCLAMHNKYMNNHNYNRTIFLVNSVPHLDNGFVLLKEDLAIASPISVLYYEVYSEISTLKDQLTGMADQIQCIVAKPDQVKQAIGFGKSQSPSLTDYADGIDTMKFLLEL